MKSYKKFEQLVARIQKQLAPDAKVEHNIRLPGRNSRTNRQIDVLVSQKVGQYDIKIIIDCKDYSDPVDVKGVEEFYGLFEDVGAHKGVLVCPKGFTETAKKRAEGFLIDLYSPVDTGEHKWKVNPLVPAICDFRQAAISFGFSISAPYPFTMPQDFFSSVAAYNADGTKLGLPLPKAIEKWNNGRYPIDEGEHKNIPIFDTLEVCADNGHGMRVPIDLSIDLYIERQLFFGHFPITEMSGFKDEIHGGIITNAFSIGLLDPNEIFEKWTPLTKEEDAPIHPVMTMRGLLAWPE